jgi:cytochrome c oxidase subunit 6b
MPFVLQVVTAPYDPRFPNTNQSRHCFIRYNEFYK